MVIGGQALLLYGEPRLTKDIDVSLGIKADEASTFGKLITRAGFKILVDSPGDFVRKTFVLPSIDQKSGIRIDFIFTETGYERRAIRRARRVRIGRSLVSFSSVEDLVIQKIVARRPRDLEDVRSILRKNPLLDARYVIRWLKKFEVVLDQKLVRVFDKLRKQVK